MRKFLIIVEGVADKKFLLDYYQHLFHEKAPQNSIIHTGDLIDDEKKKSGGKDKLTHEVNIRQMQENGDLGGINLVIFDADNDPEKCRKIWNLLKSLIKSTLNFSCFPMTKIPVLWRICWSKSSILSISPSSNVGRTTKRN